MTDHVARAAEQGAGELAAIACEVSVLVEELHKATSRLWTIRSSPDHKVKKAGYEDRVMAAREQLLAARSSAGQALLVLIGEISGRD